jgi:hypothetical protein
VNDPGRIREGGSDAPPELRDLFIDAAKPEPLTAQIDAQLAAQIGSLSALPASSVVKIVPWLALGGGGLLLVGAVALVTQQQAPGPLSPPAPPAPVEAPVPPDPVPSAPVLALPPAAAISARPSMPRAKPTEASNPSEDTLAGEAKLLNQAHAVMATDPRKALAIGNEHAKRYPRGQLAAERELILVQALVKLGRAREAETRGRALRKSAPKSIYDQRLDAILEGR